MKILEKSKIVDFRNVNYICRKCKAKLSVDKDDLIAKSYIYGLLHDEESKIGFGFECPECKEFNWIEPDESIPLEIREKLIQQYKEKNKSDFSFNFNLNFDLKSIAVLIAIAGFLTYFFL